MFSGLAGNRGWAFAHPSPASHQIVPFGDCCLIAEISVSNTHTSVWIISPLFQTAGKKCFVCSIESRSQSEYVQTAQENYSINKLLLPNSIFIPKQTHRIRTDKPLISINDILSSYTKLCNYCDTFSMQVEKRFKGLYRCRRGCSSCCKLQTVTPLEAFIIYQYLQKVPGLNYSNNISDAVCPFLIENQCSMYTVRPIICRTHGVPIYSGEDETSSVSICPLNEPIIQNDALEKRFLFDTNLVTEHLIRFNLAFCTIHSISRMASQRISLHSILSDNIPSYLKDIFDHS